MKPHTSSNIYQPPFVVLLVIDLQKQFKDDNGQYEKCIEYIKNHIDDNYVLGTVFINSDDSMYEKHLKWSGCKNVNYRFNGMSEDIEYPFHKLILKRGYGINIDNQPSCFKDIYNFASKQQNCCVPTIQFQLMGCDADACVLASAFELWDKGYDFVILSDYIYTTAKEFDKDQIIKIMRRNFGDCVK